VFLPKYLKHYRSLSVAYTYINEVEIPTDLVFLKNDFSYPLERLGLQFLMLRNSTCFDKGVVNVTDAHRSEASVVCFEIRSVDTAASVSAVWKRKP
jgi:hypothetical protein